MATAQKPAEDQQDDQNKTPAKAVPKALVVTKTFYTQGKDKKRVKFIASPKPQDLGEHAEMAVEAGVARLPTKDDD